ncbi:CD83 antigen [Collichthys lucidus]|uniref:CD83 antigen n=1 Tax=Collichthys lucidus TaxID=240159 RepID=A0A4U5V4Y5_COLLU|nr:CD83 antigen [Collichthys lucidus]
MSPVELYLLLSLGVSLSVGMSVKHTDLEVVSVSGEDSVLECTADPKAGVQYRAVRWYKVRDPSSDARLSGLLMKHLPNGTTQWYKGAEGEVEFVNESRNIRLSNGTCADSGVYVCHLAAPVGEQNREGRVLLTLTDCPTEDLTNNDDMTDAYMVIVATAVLVLALVIFRISYVSLKNTIKDRSVTPKKETLLDAPMKPLEKKDLMLIYTLGPKVPKSDTLKHICV